MIRNAIVALITNVKILRILRVEAKNAHLLEELVDSALKPATATTPKPMKQMYNIEMSRHLSMLTF
jgi:hypothetical protein